MFLTGRRIQNCTEIFSKALCMQCSGSCTVLFCDVLIKHRNTRTHRLLLTSRHLQLLLNHFSERTADSCTSSQDTRHDPWNTIPLSVITSRCTVPQARLIHFIHFKRSHPFRISRQKFCTWQLPTFPLSFLFPKTNILPHTKSTSSSKL